MRILVATSVLRTMIRLKRQGIQFEGRPRCLVGKTYFSRGSGGTFKIGAAFRADAYRHPTFITCEPGAELEIGSHFFINGDCQIRATKSIRIGNHVLVAEGCIIEDNGSHQVTPSTGVRKEAIKIGNNVWIARRVMISPGADIGDHCMIYPGAIVPGKAFPARSLIAGVPAKVIGSFECADDWIRR